VARGVFSSIGQPPWEDGAVARGGERFEWGEWKFYTNLGNEEDRRVWGGGISFKGEVLLSWGVTSTLLKGREEGDLGREKPSAQRINVWVTKEKISGLEKLRERI